MASSVVFRAVALLLVAVSMALAQVTPSVSTDPLGGSTFTTPVYSPSQTFTPVTTYATAASRTPTTIGGATGPSPATGSYAFTYDAPISTVTNTPLDNVLSSVAANGEPTDYTRPFQPNPPLSHLPSPIDTLPPLSPFSIDLAVSSSRQDLQPHTYHFLPLSLPLSLGVLSLARSLALHLFVLAYYPTSSPFPVLVFLQTSPETASLTRTLSSESQKRFLLCFLRMEKSVIHVPISCLMELSKGESHSSKSKVHSPARACPFPAAKDEAI
ncbi:hypothetical protein FA10DRAFT_19083 [Acaromyces ingoldii]|uniref:REJ domain-containing protein n=1 Tax=Acaromyces ingoldii TaxID=215250 RepID=A0A316YXF0_9BASI|nr:hypothetical protein FA10DRAFT_19083 [Acaromyces ingoldii]PWN93328.1 hypothetical protein FA10DRAFT_19083 [Acaromyces ingoldii]